jgi:hypothetical protein
VSEKCNIITQSPLSFTYPQALGLRSSEKAFGQKICPSCETSNSQHCFVVLHETRHADSVVCEYGPEKPEYAACFIKFGHPSPRTKYRRVGQGIRHAPRFLRDQHPSLAM